jgi:hypothetical protein
MARLFTDVLGDIYLGTLNAELTSELAKVTEAVLATGKAGHLTVMLKVSPNGEDSFEIVPQVKAKVPESNRAKSIFWRDKHGSLVRTDPKQRELDLRDVNDERKVREM